MTIRRTATVKCAERTVIWAACVGVTLLAAAGCATQPAPPPMIPDIPEEISSDEAEDMYESYALTHSDRALTFTFAQGPTIDEYPYGPREMNTLAMASPPGTQAIVNRARRRFTTGSVLGGIAVGYGLVSVLSGGPSLIDGLVILAVDIPVIIFLASATNRYQEAVDAYNDDFAVELGLEVEE